ncbi:GNAT family N-acetyltransferase [Croceibacter atlanticus]|uniref:GNAT family N-acetyltransferase n=1 Tax=Croceibacter atlanticus TaxID=313588 RepID=UPI0024B903BF|nr:GNAT family N-acetyltransferase [Croceibacter atlanticus]
MVIINKNISLKKIKLKDSESLFQLMKVVYTKAYSYLWEEQGEWYLNLNWTQDQVLKELNDTKASYYFVLVNDEYKGVLRFIEDAEFKDMKENMSLKLHRLYLDDSIQGKGVGKHIMTWVEQYAKDNDYNGVWLEAMDTKVQALEFYKRCGYKITSNFRLDFKRMHSKYRGMHNMYKTLE